MVYKMNINLIKVGYCTSPIVVAYNIPLIIFRKKYYSILYLVKLLLQRREKVYFRIDNTGIIVYNKTNFD